MPNTLLTPQVIAREALMVLENNLVMAGLVHRDFASEFARVGDTVNIRRPATFIAKEFTGEIEVQEATEASIPVRLDTHLDVSFALGPRELTLDIADFSTQFIQPAMRAHAQKIDSLLCGLYAAVPYRVGTAGTTPDALADIALSRKALNVRGVPLGDRSLVIDPEAETKFLLLDAVVNAEKSGSTEALREASLGRLLGFGVYMDQNVRTHAAGAGTVVIDHTDGYLAGATTLHLTGITTALTVGDLLTIGDQPYVVTAADALATADQDVAIYPALAAPVANEAPVTVIADHAANLAFHRNAFALVTRPLAVPLGAANAEVLDYRGLAIRVVYTYNATSKVDTVSLDLLIGAQCLYPELAVRLLG